MFSKQISWDNIGVKQNGDDLNHLKNAISDSIDKAIQIFDRFLPQKWLGWKKTGVANILRNLN